MPDELMTPEVDKLNPAGSDPEAKDHEYPDPLPPVANAGVQPVSVAVSLVFTVFVASFVHFPGGAAAADAGMASGTASIDADAATMTNARVRADIFM